MRGVSTIQSSYIAYRVGQQRPISKSLFRHIDNGGSPNAWLHELVNQTRTENEQARGELLSLSVGVEYYLTMIFYAVIAKYNIHHPREYILRSSDRAITTITTTK